MSGDGLECCGRGCGFRGHAAFGDGVRGLGVRRLARRFKGRFYHGRLFVGRGVGGNRLRLGVDSLGLHLFMGDGLGSRRFRGRFMHGRRISMLLHRFFICVRGWGVFGEWRSGFLGGHTQASSDFWLALKIGNEGSDKGRVI